MVLQGQFGDFDGQQDATYTVKDAQGNVIETYALTGDGMGMVYKDDEYEYVSFSGTNETTSVNISAKEDLKVGNYIGSTLKVETAGSITAGNISLQNTNINANGIPGLTLRSGVGNGQNAGVGDRYSITDLSLSGFNYIPGSINNFGQAVASSYGQSFLYSNGQTSSLANNFYASQINDLGQVVGSFNSKAFLYNNGQITNLGVLPGATSSEAEAINNLGQIAGYSWKLNLSADDWNHAFLYSNGQMNDLGVLPGGRVSVASGINDLGQVVGFSDSSNGRRAFLYSNGQMSDLGVPPGGSQSYAWDINNSGQIVASYIISDGGNRAFFYDNGQMKDLVLPGDIYSAAEDINNLGQVVGSSAGTSGGHAFLYKDNLIKDLNSLIPSDSGWILVDARAINDKGQIVGGGTKEGQYRGFLLNPLSSASGEDITVGNISTFGDSVLLQGGKINLTGSQVTTSGGNVTLDGATILNSSTGNFNVDSTNSSNGGGNISFKNTVDGASAGTQKMATLPPRVVMHTSPPKEM